MRILTSLFIAGSKLLNFCLKIILRHVRIDSFRGVVVRERRSGRYFGARMVLQQISLATGGTLTLKRSGKSRCTR